MTTPPADVAARSFLIAARAMNGVIGSNNGIPWKSKGDMSFFRRKTMGCALIIGKATWDSLPGKLPGREIVVVTSHPTDQDVRFEPSLEAAVGLALSLPGSPAIAFAGGRRIYEEALRLPWLSNMYLTEVDARPDGDVFMPEIGMEWCELSSELLPQGPGEPRCLAYRLHRDHLSP